MIKTLAAGALAILVAASFYLHRDVGDVARKGLLHMASRTEAGRAYAGVRLKEPIRSIDYKTVRANILHLNQMARMSPDHGRDHKGWQMINRSADIEAACPQAMRPQPVEQYASFHPCRWLNCS